MKEHICEVCGRASHKKLRAGGKTVCNKHRHQFRKHGRFLDSNPRTVHDRNEIRVDGDVAYMDLYDRHCDVVATTVFDAEDIPKVQYTKWKLSASGYVMNTPKFGAGNKHFSRTVLGTDNFVDHRDGNTLNNRKYNLRETAKSTNAMNQKKPKGVRKQENGKFYAYIKKNQRMLNLGTYVDEEEACWARWHAERILFGEFAREAEEPVILDIRKEQIKEYVDRKVQRL